MRKLVCDQASIPGDVGPVVFRARIAAQNARYLVQDHVKRLAHWGVKAVPLALVVHDVLKDLHYVGLFGEVAVGPLSLLENGPDFVNLTASTSFITFQRLLDLGCLPTHSASSFS